MLEDVPLELALVAAVVLEPPAELQLEHAQVRGYVEASTAKNTRRAYAADWRAFLAWCAPRELKTLAAAPSTVASYLAHLAASGKKTSTIIRAAAALSTAHKTAGETSPVLDAGVRAVLSGIRRTHGSAPTKKAPVVVEDLRLLVGKCGVDVIGRRDRALLVVGFAGAFRRSELVGLELTDLEEQRDGVLITLRKSKTDQDGAGRIVGVPFGSDVATCPVRVLRAWLEAGNISAGRVFRSVTRHGRVGDALSDRAVANVVKARAGEAGMRRENFAGHSLRSGFVTTAAKAGKPLDVIMAQTGHKSTATVLGYIRRASVFEHNGAAGIGL